METAEQLTAVKRTVEGRTPRLRSRVLTDEPIMIQTIKQEKTRPKGHGVEDLLLSKTGVHKKTKMYMMDSNID